ncbi:MAG: hypothetical protein HY749_07740 [Gammaproteobacteria bacterium]|nr:hypothetical protein [Gammaproteobacteria bacterium]
MTRISWRTALVVALLVAHGAPAAEKDSGPAGERLATVRKLIEVSSGAKLIEASRNTAAAARRDEARGLYRQAVAAEERGDSAKARELATAAVKVMIDAVRLVEAKSVVAGKRESDYQDRLASVRALKDAHERISAEKGTERKDAELKTFVDDRIAAAEKARAAGNLLEARRLIDEAYTAAKASIVSLRTGETLVRSLHFENKEEEYRYELDRNDTHRMLVQILLKDKMDDAATVRLIEPFLNKAAEIRGTAERQAAAGNWASAVGTLEESTKELVKAIRGAGVYIPG